MDLEQNIRYPTNVRLYRIGLTVRDLEEHIRYLTNVRLYRIGLAYMDLELKSLQLVP